MEEKEYQRKHEVYLRDLEKHVDKSKERKEYAIKQFDTLMIALSTAGLGFVSTYIKDMDTNILLARISQTAFLCCILANLFSHIASMWCNECALENAEELLRERRYNEITEEEDRINFQITQFQRDNRMRFYGKIVKALNVFAFLCLFSAIVTFFIFALIF